MSTDGLIANLRNANNAARIDLEAIKARAAAATEGPWELTASKVILGPQSTEHSLAQWVVGLVDLIYEADAEFIAAARADVPALVAEVERLRERESTLIRVKDADLDDARDEINYLTAEVERLRAIEARP